MASIVRPYRSDTLSVLDIFTKKDADSNLIYNIPIYQRYYTWGKQNITDLLSDIQEAVDGKEAGFFLGPVLFRTEKHHDDIIDGQQRILTISIIISHLMHSLAYEGQGRKKAKVTDGIDKAIYAAQCCLWQTDKGIHNLESLEVEEIEPRINFSAKENDTSYEFIICKNQTVGGSSPLSRSLKIIKEYFNDKTLMGKTKFLNYILGSTFFVVIRTTQSHSINKIFETLNDRGMPLSQVELFKNFVSGYVPVNSLKDDFFQQSYISLKKSTDNLEKYFWTYCLSIYGHGEDGSNKVNAWYRFWKKQILKNRNKPIIQSQLKKLAINISSGVKYYQAILSIDDPYWTSYELQKFPDLSEKAAFLMRYKITHPLLFTLIKRQQTGLITIDVLYECFAMLYSFIARIWLVYGLSRPQQVEEMLVEAAYQINNGEMEVQAKDILELLKTHRPSKYTYLIADEIFIKELKSISYAPSDHRPKFILSALNKGTSTDPAYSAREGKVHHVLPQNINNLDGWEAFDMESYTEHKDLLGNMVLLEPKLSKEIRDNSSINFEEVKEIFEKSLFSWARDLSDKRVRWKTEKIISLQKEYAQVTAKILSLDAGPVKEKSLLMEVLSTPLIHQYK